MTIGGVTSTYTVTTATQAIPQAGFTAVTGASVSSTQISNRDYGHEHYGARVDQRQQRR